jgi:pimeloyl-ACP methyl ester carboxylesterase
MYFEEAIGTPIDADVVGSTRSVSIEREEPVVVLPGFLGSDLSTALLRATVRGDGIATLPWELGTNLGPSRDLMQRLIARIERVNDETGRRVGLVGHSLGGLYAREIAKFAPERVRIVITLGSPIRALEANNPYANLEIVRLIELICGRTVTDLQRHGYFCNLAAPLTVPCVAIYSKRDRVAPWQTCLQQPAPLAQNVEVDATHVGMLISATVAHVIRDRLTLRSDFDA